MNVKIEQELNFVVDNDSRLFLDAQEAKKVSQRTVVDSSVSAYVYGYHLTIDCAANQAFCFRKA